MPDEATIKDDGHDAEEALERAKEESDRRNEAVSGDDAHDPAESDIAASEGGRG